MIANIAQLGIPGGVELLVVLLIAVLLFGANKIPKLARSVGRSINEFKAGAKESKQALQESADLDAADDEDVEAAD